MKKIAFILTIGTAFLLTACSGGFKSKNCIYGDLPEKLEKIEKEAKKDFESMKKDGLDIEESLNIIKAVREKMEEETAECRASLVGKVLPYELSDSLPYTICSDITVTEVELSKKLDVRMKAEFDIEFTETVELPGLPQYYKICYIPTGESGPMYAGSDDCSLKDVEIIQKPDGAGGTFPNKILKKGDKLHAKISFSAAGYQAMATCDRLKFVPKKDFDDARDEANMNRIHFLTSLSE
ncbi:MAG: hypothetical protein IJ901_11720 [Bacteroidaceae bacterium]|jgi:hypothetical protein|nr:hypothetical protein [Bacteroidaceae bacterium]